MSETVNVQVIMQEIRERIREQATFTKMKTARPFPFGSLVPDLSEMERVGQDLRSRQLMFGERPPAPRTLRARLGSLIVRIVRPALFWQTVQLRSFHAGVVEGYDQQLAAFQSMAAEIQNNRQIKEDLWKQVADLTIEIQHITHTMATQQAATKRLIHAMVAGENKARQILEDRLDGESKLRNNLSERLAAEIKARESSQNGLRAEVSREQLTSAPAEESLSQQQLEANDRQTKMELHHLRADLSGQSARISALLIEARKRLPEKFSEGQLLRIVAQEKNVLDSLYLELEDRFRGSRREIKERMRFYLPLLQKLNIGTQDLPVLDLGCGRGEWLQLLGDFGIEACGVDMNEIFVTECKEMGLNVVREDVVEHLSRLPDSSIGAVTGFHIIEHLPLDILVSLLDHTVRVLKPGGVAIFETPNPQNVLVGSHSFYIDPTHRNPIPCLTAQFLLEARGLCNVEIFHLHPFPETFHIQDNSVLAQRFNEYFYGAQDYAVMGHRV